MYSQHSGWASGFLEYSKAESKLLCSQTVSDLVGDCAAIYLVSMFHVSGVACSVWLAQSYAARAFYLLRQHCIVAACLVLRLRQSERSA